MVPALERQQKHHKQHDQSRYGHTGGEAIVVKARHDNAHREALLLCNANRFHRTSVPSSQRGKVPLRR
jgi:hypothetical protein